MSAPRVLFASTEPPTVGGSGTASLDLFRRMLADGWDVHYVHVVHDVDAAFHQMDFQGRLGDVGGIANLQYCCVPELSSNFQASLASIMTRIAPDVSVGFGFLATGLLKAAAPDCRVVFVTGTCRQAQDFVTTGRARDATELERGLVAGSITPRIINNGEKVAVGRCDLLVTHSEQTKAMFGHFFAESIGKMYPSSVSFAEWIAAGAEPWKHLARTFAERDIDVLFIASDWGRVEKNYPLVSRLGRPLDGLRVHLVGDVPHPLGWAVHHGFLPDRQTLFELMGRAKSIVCPSLIDAAPGILFEGAMMGCNLVASKNCGNWEVCHPDLVVEPFDEECVAKCIHLATSRKYDDRLDRFTAQGAYRELTAIIQAITQPFEAQAI
jgi:glycosyltransferase involved in cell wall biosynthesis